MSVVIGFEEAGAWRKRLTIEVPAPAVEAETGRVLKELSRKVALPGFRKGKVPASLILKRFPDEVEQKVAERLVPRYWHQAEAEKSLDALAQPKVEDLRFEPGAPMTFVAVVETRPEIELKNTDDFTLPEGDAEPGDDAVEQMIRDMRRRHADWKSVDRPAATGDRVEGEVVEISAGAEDGEDGEDGDDAEDGDDSARRQPLRVEIGGDGVDEELSLALTGLRPGQQTTFRRPIDEEGATRLQDYRIEMTKVEEEDLPELDDDFAQKVGAQNVDELRTNVAGHLRMIKQAELSQKRREAVLEQLRERHPLELPEGMVEREVERLLHDQASRLASQGIDLETAPINWEAMAAQVRPEAQKRAHNSLLLDAVAKKKALKLDEAEFERALADIARQQKKTSLAVRQELDAAGRLPQLRAQLLESRTLRHLLGEDESQDTESQDTESQDTESDTP